VDRERLQAAPVPAGWCSWYELRDRVTEADVVAHVELCASTFDRRFFHYIQVDQGYERAAGDWDANEKFPHGHRWLTNQIHAKGLQAGLWLAPFAVAERSEVAAAHPDWLLKNADGSAPIVWATREDWGGRVYALDGAHPGAQQWLADLARRAVEQWGYDYLKLDLLAWATGESTHYGGLTHAEAYRLGVGALRDGAGPDTFLLGAGAPLQPSAGLVNGMRIGPDVDVDWATLHDSARAAALRSYYHRGVWLNDPDCLLVRAPLSPAEAQIRATIVALTGGLTFFSDDLRKLPAERLAWLARVLPPTPVAGQPLGAAVGEAAAGGRPAETWIAEGAPRWWTAALVNWGDEARELKVPLHTLGIAGKRFSAYDVWRETPLPDLTDTISVKLDPHSGLTVAIRPVSARPQVIGTTRHIVQGAVDVVDETWDARTSTLKGRCTNLDARPYAITIALPSSLRVGGCKANVPCQVRALDSGHAVLEWEAGGSGDLAWQLSFRPVKKR
jgi:alpha-galactosidase